jgi:transposase
MSLPTPPLPPEIWDRVLPEAQALILVMQAEIAALRAEVADLKSRLDKNSSNSHKPPSSDSPSFQRPSKKKTGRKRGGQPGHPGYFRALLPPERVDHSFDYFPDACRDCGDSLDGAPIADAPLRHQICEIPPVAVTVTEHRLHRCLCRRCGVVTIAEAPTGVMASCFGPNLEGLVGTLVGRYRLSRRNAQQLIHDITDVRVSLGTVVAICHRVATALVAPFEAIAQAIRQSPYAHVDETGFKESGQRRTLWVASTKGLSYFRILGSRSRDDRRRLLGELGKCSPKPVVTG